MHLMKPEWFSFKASIQAVVISFVCLLSVQAFAAEATGMWRYTVRPGDNLITLGKQHLLNPDDWKEVQRINHIKNPYRMHVGKVIQVPLGLVKQGPAKAEVIFVSGEVLVQKSANDFAPLKMGQKLGAGASVTTKENSKVVVKFADGTTAELASNSQLKLDTMSLYSGGAMVDTKLRLQKGQLETHANPAHVKGNQFQVITPTAIAAVRGTKFRVSADAKAMTQETLDGSVALAALGNEIAVDKGYGSKAEKGKPPIPPVVLLPAPTTAGLKAQHNTIPVTFDLPAMAGVAAWVGKVATDEKLNHLVDAAETQGKQLVFKELPDGEYYLSLRAKDVNGIAGYDAAHAFTLNARPLQPVASSPAESSVVRESQPVLQWGQSVGAQHYAIEVASDNLFQHMIEKGRVTATEYRLRKSLVPGTYFWRVAGIAKDEDGIEDRGPAINVSQFSVKALPPKPDISQLTVNIAVNRVTVNTIAPLDGYTYQAVLDNEFNDQKNVWEGSGLGAQFDFLLYEYGKQTLTITHVDSDGIAGPAAVYEFDAHPQ